MEAKLCFWLITVCLSSALAADIEKFFTSGGSLELRPPEKSSVPITRIVWKHNGNLVADWDGGNVDYYGKFDGRTTLNTNSGQVIISNMSKSDEGQYWVEINSQEQRDRYTVRQKVFVPTPEILLKPLKCGPASIKDCFLICNATISDEYPITYSWKKGDGEWEDINNKTIDIVKDVKTYTCKMKNQFSEKESPPFVNPAYKEEQQGSSVGLGVGLFLLVVCIILAVIAILKHDYLKKKFGSFMNRINGRQGQTEQRDGQTEQRDGQTEQRDGQTGQTEQTALMRQSDGATNVTNNGQ